MSSDFPRMNCVDFHNGNNITRTMTYYESSGVLDKQSGNRLINSDFYYWKFEEGKLVTIIKEVS